jgi:glycerol-3-phosphate dehydrogenase
MSPREPSPDGFDVIVVGGGIHGLCLALKAAQRDLRPLLLERDPGFGRRTTASWFRILHGGLRYLQSLDLVRHRESVAERSWFVRNFPDLVEPLPCLMPLYGEGLKRPAVLKLALMLDAALARRRNAGVAPARRLPAGRVLDAAATRGLFPLVRADGLAGAALWYDATTRQSEALIEALRAWVEAAGGTTLAGMTAEALLLDGGRVRGLVARDAAGGRHEFAAPLVINAAGPWARQVAAKLDRDLPSLFEPALAFNLLFDREPVSGMAVAVSAPRPDAPVLFLHALDGRLFAGTWHAPWSGPLDALDVPEAVLAAFVADLNAAVPGLALGLDQVRRVYPGILPTMRPGGEEQRARDVILDHGSLGGPRGLVSLSGIKLTTARAVAEKVLRRGLAAIGRPLPPVSSRPRPEAQVDSPLYSSENSAISCNL